MGFIFVSLDIDPESLTMDNVDEALVGAFAIFEDLLEGEIEGEYGEVINSLNIISIDENSDVIIVIAERDKPTFEVNVS